MPTTIPNEIVMARLSIATAHTALESLFERMHSVPRAERNRAQQPGAYGYNR